MSERAYRQRLDADIARWENEGIITVTTAEAIRGALRPAPQGVTVASVVAIVGGLLIAAAFLAFIAANWTVIARPYRFGILLAGIAAAYIIGAWCDREVRPHLADLSVAVGSIVFGSAIALVGQMYHLGDDFAGGMLLLASGALAAAALTGSQGALAVALVAGSMWSGMRVSEYSDIHLPFIGFWLIAAFLAVVWNAAPSRHLVALAAVAWWLEAGYGFDRSGYVAPIFAVAAGFSLMLGAGLALASRGSEQSAAFGLTLSHYGALALAMTLAALIAIGYGPSSSASISVFVIGLGALGAVLAFAATAIAGRAGPALAGAAIVLTLAVTWSMIGAQRLEDPWLIYALALAAMLCLVVSGMLDDVRPRVVAGWIGLACVIAAITWAVQGSLLRRAVFLAAAGLVAIGLASVLGRIRPRVRRW
jgi:uncharacterized membrane protein